MSYPVTRLRRLRKNPAIRNMIRETEVNRDDLIMPYFVCPGENVRNPINSMPGNFQLSIDLLIHEVQDLIAQTGVNKILLFGIPESKDEDGTGACSHDAIVPRAIRALKATIPGILVIADVCNC